MGRPRKVPEVPAAPKYLVFIAHYGMVRLFSAHCNEANAKAMANSLDAIGTGDVSIVEVPAKEGVLADPQIVASFDFPGNAPANCAAEPASPARSPEPVPRPAPYRERTPEEIEAATESALLAGGSHIISGADLDGEEPIS